MSPFLEFLDEINANQGRAVEPQELSLDHILFNALDRSSHRIGVAVEVKFDIVAIRFGPVNLIESQQYPTAVLFHEQSRLALRPNFIK